MDFISLFKQIDYWSLIVAIIKWGLLFLFLSIVVLIVANKFRLFKRETKWANILVKAYYILIPLYFVLFSLSFAIIKNTQAQLNKAIDKNKGLISGYIISKISSPEMYHLLAADISIEDALTALMILKFEQEDALTKSENKGVVKRRVVSMKRKIERSFWLRMARSKLIEKISETVKVSGTSSEKFFTTTIKSLFVDGEIVEVVKIELNQVFKKINKTRFMFFILGLFLPVIEILLAKKLKY